YGRVFQTDAVIREISAEKGDCPIACSGDTLSFLIEMKEEDIVYGLGENVRGINKRGWKYVSYALDNSHHQEDTNSLYGGHNFFVEKRKEDCLGVFVDFPGKLTFDVGYTRKGELRILPQEADLDLYLITGERVASVVKEFRGLIGRSYIPPKWAFGFGQSRWGYKNEADIREVVKRHRENGIPLDSVYMDIDYMKDYKDFTVDEERFPKFGAFVEEMKAEHIHLVPIIDAGVKIEEGYDVCEEGMEKGYFCKDADGNDYATAVWPGRTYFPDVLNREARVWFGNKYQRLTDLGIEGFWNDMNEPAIFYTDGHLAKTFENMDACKGKNLGIDEWFGMLDAVMGTMNSEEDYRQFYHNVNGEQIRHDKVHNLYGYHLTRAAAEAFERIVPDKRILMFSRSSYIGMHRYGGIWTGDNRSWWSHILLNLQMMPALNMCGILYTGADLGGFGSDTTPDLLERWLAFGVFTPLMRNHSAADTREQEAYQFEEMEELKSLMKVRYQLLPYIYSEYMKAALEDELYFRPLAFDYPEDSMAANVEDQLLVGESLMVAPVYTQNARGRNVYLPESMKMLKLGGCEDLEGIVLEKGWHYIEVPMDTVVFFLRKGHLLPVAKGGECVAQVDFEDLKLVSYGDGEVTYRYYQDDGYSKDYDEEKHVSILKA
ncbi:MAG: glycoside hydrolase family 31 protein, partial [Eubacteriales bacterium]|nr:glycoside hydrolase family 31 protein [Eubacteriales bacterium]